MCSEQQPGWPGARWWKVDFHTHTPASHDYGGRGQSGLEAPSAEDWLLDYMRAGIDCLAVTDHNSGKWIDELKAARDRLRDEPHADFRELVIFPGVEISVHGGVHLLAIFDIACSCSDIERLLGAVGYRGDAGESESLTSKPLLDVAREVEAFGGIAIPAHVDQHRGLSVLR